MVSVSNNIVTMNRGDTFSMPVLINIGTKFDPKRYTISSSDKVYLAIGSVDQPFEDALIRREFDVRDSIAGGLRIWLEPKDTEKVLPGQYYYEIKLVHSYKDEFGRDHEFIDTIVPRNKFIILE